MSLDIVIPAHNEEGRIGRTLAAYRAAIPESDVRFHVALDDCADGTASIVSHHRSLDGRVVLHAYPKLGKGGVLMETFRRCDATYVGFVDADCATPPSELLRLVDALPYADMVIGSRHHAASVVPGKRELVRRVASAGFALSVRRLFGLPFTDTQCGAKVLRRDALERVIPLLSSRDLLIDVDLLLVTRALGLRVLEVPTVWIDQPGSRIRPWADTRKMSASLLRLWLHHRILPVPTGSQPVAETDAVIHLDGRAGRVAS